MMRPGDDIDPSPDSPVPTLNDLLDGGAVVPPGVVAWSDYRDDLSVVDHIVEMASAPPDPDPESLVVTVPLPNWRNVIWRRRCRSLVGASAMALVLFASGGVAFASWFAVPELNDEGAVPISTTVSREGLDARAASLAISGEALFKLQSRRAAKVEPFAATDPAALRRRTAAAKDTPLGPKVAAQFDAGAASSALDRGAILAASCRTANEPTGIARVIITFAPSGRATTATINGPPFAGTETGSCIAHRMRATTVPPFTGEHVTVAKTVAIY